jgi:hypothetical protein
MALIFGFIGLGVERLPKAGVQQPEGTKLGPAPARPSVE